MNLKPLSIESIPAAIEKAEHYRNIGEPTEAESICLDVLDVEPQHTKAVITLLLALSDQFDDGLPGALKRAQQLVPKLPSDYFRAYYAGIICERQAKAILKKSGSRARSVVYDWFRQAMSHCEDAEKLRPKGNDDAVLRWNTCVRILQRNPHLAPEPESGEHMLE